MESSVPAAAVAYGFVTEPTSTHTSRTIQLRELSLLLDASCPDAPYEELRRLVVEENVCLKATEAGRRETFRRLRELYALQTACPLYRALRDLWPVSPAEQPLLAMLLAVSRDTLLRSTAPLILDLPDGETIGPQAVTDALQSLYPDRYSPAIRAGFGRRVLSSWTQSGHLEARSHKVRRRAVSGPAAAAYALFLGYLCGARGLSLLDTVWARMLDDPSPDSLAFAASQRGWLEYRRIGDVLDIGFRFLLRQKEAA